MNDSIAKLSYLAGTSGNTAIFMERRSAQTGEFKVARGNVARGKISQAQARLEIPQPHISPFHTAFDFGKDNKASV